MKVIGVTGGIGSGKSTILSTLKSISSCEVIMADDVAKALYKKGRAGYLSLLELFGKDILDADEEIDKVRLANIIFNNAKALDRVNNAIHPLVKEEIKRIIHEHRMLKDVDFVFVEAALLLEDNYKEFLDEIWYVYVPENIRRERLKIGRGYTDDKIDSILKNQMSDEAFKKQADVIIDNSDDAMLTATELEEYLHL